MATTLNPPEHGHVEAVLVHDEGYWSIFVDGTLFDVTHHADFTEIVFRIKNRQAMAKRAGVEVDDLRYTIYGNFFTDMYTAIPDTYDANDYLEDYTEFENAVKQFNLKPTESLVDLNYLENHY